MKIEHVKGEKKGKLLLYALSTCIWCKKTKQLLSDLGVDYSYIFVDLLDESEKEEATDNIKKWNPKCSFPTLIIDDKKCIVGFKEQEIKETLKI